MTHALLVEDDETAVAPIQEALRSMGHTCDVAMTQEAAELLLASNAYDYFLLDLVIPLYDKGLVSKQHGRNLLLKIKAMPGHRDRPVIVITAHDLETFTTAVDVMKLGAVDYVAKPFTAENPLEDKIRQALKLPLPARGTDDSQPRQEGEESAKPFTGGYLDFYQDRVEFCGEKIAGPEGQSCPRQVLDLLKRRSLANDKRNYDSRFIARELGFGRGAGAVSDAIFQIRESCAKAMESQSVHLEKNDVICNRHRGYVFAQQIEVRNHAENIPAAPQHDHTEHQLAILRELRKEGSMSRPALAERLHLTVRAVDSETAALVTRKEITKVGSGAAMRFKMVAAGEPDAG